MRERRERKGRAAGLSGRERGVLAEFLVDIEDRVKDVEPVCARLVRMARLSLGSPDGLKNPDRVLP